MRNETVSELAIFNESGMVKVDRSVAVMEKQELLERIVGFLHGSGGHELGLLATADKEGVAHVTYMGTVASPTIDRLLTMTAPESRKVENILENPRVEWLFLDEEKQEVLYLRGTARVIEDPVDVEKAWKQIPDKSRAYFLSFQDVGIKFLILETAVESFEYRLPQTNEAFHATSEEIKQLLS